MLHATLHAISVHIATADSALLVWLYECKSGYVPLETHQSDPHSLVGPAKHRHAKSESAKLFGTPSIPCVVLGRCGGGGLVPVWRNDARIR